MTIKERIDAINALTALLYETQVPKLRAVVEAKLQALIKGMPQ